MWHTAARSRNESQTWRLGGVLPRAVFESLVELLLFQESYNLVQQCPAENNFGTHSELQFKQRFWLFSRLARRQFTTPRIGLPRTPQKIIFAQLEKWLFEVC